MTRLFRLTYALVPVILLSGTAMASSVRPDAAVLASHRAVGPSEWLGYVIHNGCPYGLDKVCHRTRGGRLACHCAS